MVVPDINVLVHAYRRDASAHETSASWLEEQINGPSVYGIADRVVEGFLRIVTHPGAFRDPDRLGDAIEFAEALTERPNCVRVRPGDQQWGIFLELASETNATGNSVSDAWLAALAIESGSEWITWDKGFARYPGLKWATPSTAS